MKCMYASYNRRGPLMPAFTVKHYFHEPIELEYCWGSLYENVISVLRKIILSVIFLLSQQMFMKKSDGSAERFCNLPKLVSCSAFEFPREKKFRRRHRKYQLLSSVPRDLLPLLGFTCLAPCDFSHQGRDEVTSCWSFGLSVLESL